MMRYVDVPPHNPDAIPTGVSWPYPHSMVVQQGTNDDSVQGRAALPVRALIKIYIIWILLFFGIVSHPDTIII